MPNASRPAPLRSLLAAALALTLAACSAEPDATFASQPEGLVVQNPSGERPFYHLLGNIEEGQVASHTFELRNDDREPIRILRIQAACGCTVPALTVHAPGREPFRGDLYGEGPIAVVPPGAVLEVEFQIDSATVPRKNAFWLATAHMLTDSARSPYVHFEMSVFVDAPLQITPGVIDLGDVPVSGGAWGKTTAVTAVPNAPVRIVGIASQSFELEATLEERHEFQPVWELRVELAPGLPMGSYRGEVVLDVLVEGREGDEEPRLVQVAVPVRGQVVEDIIARPALLTLGAIDASGRAGARAGGAEARIVSLTPGRRIVAEDPRVEGVPADSIALTLEPIRPDSLGRAQEWLLRLEVVGPLPGPRFSGSVHLRIDEPEGPSTVVVRFTGFAG